MNIYLRYFILISLLISGCRDQKNDTDTTEKEAKGNYFPVKDYLLSEIAYVDSMPFRIVRYEIRNGKTDSAIIVARDFDRLAQAFLPAGIDSTAFEKNFTENSFMDQTTQALTFNYTIKNQDSGLQRVDVLATPNPGFDKVKSIYMEQNLKRNDTSILERMTWKAKRRFQIISIYSPSKAASFTSQLDVIWDPQ
jgi:hypothetical protein